ncbi:glycosyltransferase [Acidiferrobacter sp.]|jgi:undecaprenyl-phosphate 4-deoxy-4-formamido-L-arabinose transferase|uniref:glycosyltransferase n=1 Tax=Acidiferrobacter sp. TaxID=1872107 RepID=UPI00262732B1|nr:glycosyltransferase [Acidiferrobacter sp.]
MRPYLSVVVPVFNEEENLRPLFARLVAALDAMGRPYEIVFTNDGSADRSGEILRELHAARPAQVRVIDFNGNFGQHMAIMAAFEHVRGDVIVTLDADLQNPPEDIPRLVEKIEQGFDVVGGYRRDRQDTWFRRNASRLINVIRARITRIEMRDQGCMLRAYRRHIVDSIATSGEVSAFIPALAYSFATNPTEIEVAHAPRAAGHSKYHIYNLLRLNFDLMTGFSLVPLQVFTMLGFAVSLLSAVLVLYLLLQRIFVGPEVQGVFTLFGIMYFLVGLGIFGLGIIGEYIGRIYLEVRKRPRFVIREVIQAVDDE